MGNICCGSKNKYRTHTIGAETPVDPGNSIAKTCCETTEATSHNEIVTSSTQVFAPVSQKRVIALCATSEPTQLICSGEGGVITLYDWKSGNTLRTWAGHSNDVNRVVFADKLKDRFLTAGRDKKICLWSMHEANCVKIFSGHDFNITGLAISPDNTIFASGSRDTSVRLWNLETGANVLTSKIERNLVTTIKWIPNSHEILQAGEDLRLRVWDTRIMEVVQVLSENIQYIQTCCDVSPDGNYFISGSNGFDAHGCTATLWDRRKGGSVGEYKGHQHGITDCLFLRNGAGGVVPNIATTSHDRTIRIWNSANQSLLSMKTLSWGPVTCLALPPHGSAADLLVGGFPHFVSAWSIVNSEQLSCLSISEDITAIG